MLSVFYATSVPFVQRRVSLKPGIWPDTGCEVAPACLDCPLSQCKLDDPDWYRYWRLRAKHLAMGQALEREGLSEEEAGHRFRVGIRTIRRARRTCGLAIRILTPGDIATFTRLADAGAVREVA